MLTFGSPASPYTFGGFKMYVFKGLVMRLYNAMSALAFTQPQTLGDTRLAYQDY